MRISTGRLLFAHSVGTILSGGKSALELAGHQVERIRARAPALGRKKADDQRGLEHSVVSSHNLQEPSEGLSRPNKQAPHPNVSVPSGSDLLALLAGPAGNRKYPDRLPPEPGLDESLSGNMPPLPPLPEPPLVKAPSQERQKHRINFPNENSIGLK